MVSGNAIAVCGFDDRGAMYGLYNLIMRFSLREGPYLPKNLNTVRHSLYQARMTLSGLGWMEWPDRYLATLPLYGFDAIHCSIYRNPNNAPGPEPYWSDAVMRRHKPGVMKDLLRRTARFGIDCYAPLLYQYTGTPENIDGLRKLVREIVTEFPEIRGYVLLTEGFFYKKWFGAGGQGDEDLRAWVREWAKAVGIAADEAHKVNPKVEILPWEYNVAFSPDQVATKAYVMTQLPESTIPAADLRKRQELRTRRAEGLSARLRHQSGRAGGGHPGPTAGGPQAQLPRRLLQGGHFRQLAVRNVSLPALPVPVVCALQGAGGVEDRRHPGDLELRFQAELGRRNARLVCLERCAAVGRPAAANRAARVRCGQRRRRARGVETLQRGHPGLSRHRARTGEAATRWPRRCSSRNPSRGP